MIECGLRASRIGFLLLLLFSAPSSGRASELTTSSPHPVSDELARPAGVDQAWWTQICNDIERDEYRPSAVADGFQSPNRAQNLRIAYREQGVEITRRDRDSAGWRWHWQTVAIGRPERMQGVNAVRPVAASDRVEYQHGTWVEWYENRKVGLEQGFTLEARPAGLGPLCIDGRIMAEGLLPHPVDGASRIEFVDTDGACVVRYSDLQVIDASGKTIAADLTLTGHVLRIEVDDRDAIYPLVIDPLITSPDWTVDGEAAGIRFGMSVGTAGDVNGDNHDDVLVGAPLYDGGQIDEGRAYLYLGSPSGIGINPAWTAESNQAGAQLRSVSTAGDVNGDGFDDVIISAGEYDNGQTDEGAVFVFLGSSSGLGPNGTPSNADWMAESNQADTGLGGTAAGDVNGDTFDDIILAHRLYDFGGNAFADEGAVFVFLGSASGLGPSGDVLSNADWFAAGDQDLCAFGSSAGTAGDVNGDGFDDIIVGANMYDSGQPDEGAAFVWHGSASGLGPNGTPSNADWRAESNQGGPAPPCEPGCAAFFGHTVSTAGDVNGDGYDEVLVAARWYDRGQEDEGVVFLWLGSPTGLGPNGTPANADWSAESNQAGAEMSRGETAGDLNRDGYDDVFIGANDYTNGQDNEGAVFVYLGSASGMGDDGNPGNADFSFESDQTLATLGVSLGTAGDVNNDGFDDLIAGAFRYNNFRGRAYAFYGPIGNVPPTCDADGPYSGNVDESIIFDGTGSNDLDGTIVSYQWSFGDGSNASGATLAHSYSLCGTFTVTLTVTDNDGASSMCATAANVNCPPECNPGGLYSGNQDQPINFDGGGSTDLDGTIVSYEWDFGDGNTGTGVSPAHTYTGCGSFTVNLTVADDAGARSSCGTTANVNCPPECNPGGPYSGTQDQPISFNGTGSTDLDGTIVSYEWDFGDGATGTGPTPSHTYASAQTFTVTLTVADNDNASSSCGTTAAVSPPGGNVRPVCDAGGPYTGTTDQSISFDGSGSTDLDGTIVLYEWNFGDGAAGTGPTPTHTYSSAQTFTVTLTVTDDDNDSSTCGTTAAVSPPGGNASPICDADGPYLGTAGQPVNFDGTGSTDSDGTIVSYAWNFGDGATGTGPTPTHTYASALTFTVTLTVTDDDDASSNCETTAAISPPGGNLAPACNVGGPYNGAVGEPVSFDGSFSTDLDGTIVSYDWDFGDGSTAPDAGPTPTHIYTSAQTFNVTLSVTDDDNATSDCSTTADVVLTCILVETQEGDLGEPLSFRAQVLGACTVSTADLFVRVGGRQVPFTQIAMTRQADELRASVPAQLMTERGIEYYIVADGGTVVVPPGGQASPGFLPVAIPNLVLTPVPPAEQYVMIGMPLVPSNSDPATLLVDDLGAYDRRRWRLFRFVPAFGEYREFPATGAMDAGRGFWLIQRSPVAIDAGGTSSNSREGVTIGLAAGWNQIANPYPFPVDWSDADRRAAPDVGDSLFAFTGGGYRKQTLLSPWQGYWVLNSGSALQSVRIMGVEATGPRAPAPVPPAPAPTPATWQIAVTAVQGSKWDGPNIAAVAADASPGPDARDEHEPPPAPEHVAAWFTAATIDGDESLRRLRIDARPEPAAGDEWELEVSAQDPRIPVARLEWNGVESVPARLEVWLLDSGGSGAWDLRRRPTIEVPTGQSRRFRLAIGTRDYLDAARGPKPPLAPAVRVSPNPFNSETTIEFTLPLSATVSLRIYDAAGRLVKTLVEDHLDAGRHVASWPGRDAAGRALPSGVYYYQLVAGDASLSRSMLLIR